jgi:hypothetical protein
VDLKLVAPRQCKRVNATYTLSPSDTGASAVNSSGLARQTTMATNVSIRKMFNVKDLIDNEEDYSFSTGLDSSHGTTPSAGVPEKKAFVSTFITPSLTETITGEKCQAPACLIRVRLKQRVLFTEPRSHSSQSGVDFNLPRPYSTNYGYAKAMLAGGFTAAQAIMAHRARRIGGGGRFALGY